MKTLLNMTVGVNHFVTVTACNKVEMCTSRSSDVFYIDNTAPFEVSKPYINNLHMVNFKNITIISDPSFVKVVWKFKDQESPIVRTSISLTSKFGSHIPIKDVVLPGINKYAFRLSRNESLRQGDLYIIKITACNAASLCSTSYSAAFLVDSSPPQVGGFKPPMHYESTSDVTTLLISWYGFVDVQTEISAYFLSIGTSYSTTNILENQFVQPNITDNIQTLKITILRQISPTVSY